MKLVDETEASRMLGTSVRTLQKWRYRGGGPPFVKLGRLVRYDVEDLTEWVEARKLASTSEVS